MSPSSLVRARLKNCAWTLGVFTVQLACLVLIGWALDYRELTSTFTYLAPMNPVTAFCFVLLGAALSLSRSEMAGSRALRLARGAALVAAAIGGLRLLDALFGWDLRVDWLLFPGRMTAMADGSARMAPMAAFCLVLTGLSLASLDLSIAGRRISWPAQALGVVVALVTGVSFLSGSIELPGTSAAFMPMALNAACAFLALAFGIFCVRPDQGLVSLFQSPQPGGAVTRRLLPMVVLAPVAWFVWRFIRRAVLHSPQVENGSSAVIAGLMAGLAALICWTAVSLNRADNQRRQAQEKVRETHDMASSVIEGTTDAVFVKDLQGRYLMINAAGARAVGLPLEKIIGRDDTALFDLPTARKIIERDREIMAAGQIRTYEDIDAISDGQTRTWQSTKGPQRNQQGEVIGLIGISREITANKRAERALQEEITERRRIEQALQAAYDDLEARVVARTAELARANQAVKENEERLRLALNAGRMSTWTIHLGSGGVDWSTLRHSKGWVPGTFPATFEAFLRSVHPADLEEALAVTARCKAEGAPFIFQYRFVRPGDDTVRWLESRGQPLRDASGRVDTITGVSLDITGRKLQEARLHVHARQQAAVARLGQRALELGESSLETLFTEAAELVAEILEADFTTVFEHLPEKRVLIWRAGHGWPAEDINRPETGAPASMDSTIGHALLTSQPTVCEDVRREARFQLSPYSQRHGLVAVAAVIIARAASESGPAPAPFGVLDAVFCEPHVFSNEDVAFLQALANTLASAIASQRAHAAIQQARQEADRANAAKSEFLSRMSHELRTPLNAILGFGQLLELDVSTQGQQQGVKQILKGGRHLLSLIDEVLDLARVESGRVELSLEPVGVADLLSESLDLVRPLAAQRRIELTALDLASPQLRGVHVLADRQRLKQVLLNLLSNAVKYNGEAGRITLQCLPAPGSGNRFRIGVRDTGPGISDEQRKRLFIPFDRLGAENSSVQGTGLGLALSRRLVEAMGGTLELEERRTDQEGGGAMFYVDLPSCASVLEAQETCAEVSGCDALPALPQAKTLLYIEDNLSNLQLVQAVLMNHSAVQLMTAMRGAEGLEMARRHRPDLILLDLHLPGLPGWEVLARLQGDEATKAIPVIVVSADATALQVQRLMQAGARAYLTKPFDIPRFLAAVRGCLDAKQLEPDLTVLTAVR